MQLTQLNHSNLTIVRLKGRLDYDCVCSLRAQFETIIKTAPSDVLFNLQKVDFIDSSGLGLLVTLQTLASRKHTQAAFCCVTEQIEALLEITRMNTHLDVHPDENTAIKTLQPH